MNSINNQCTSGWRRVVYSPHCSRCKSLVEKARRKPRLYILIHKLVWRIVQPPTLPPLVPSASVPLVRPRMSALPTSSAGPTTHATALWNQTTKIVPPPLHRLPPCMVPSDSLSMYAFFFFMYAFIHELSAHICVYIYMCICTQSHGASRAWLLNLECLYTQGVYLEYQYTQFECIFGIWKLNLCIQPSSFPTAMDNSTPIFTARQNQVILWEAI